MNIETLLKEMVIRGASDLHLSSGIKPKIRVDNDLITIENVNTIDNQGLMEALEKITPEKKQENLRNRSDIDFSFEREDLKSRFRANIFHQERGLSIAIRHIPLQPPTLTQLHLPAIFEKLCAIKHGLIVISGPTGSGKSTTLAAMIDHINSHFSKHIITIEDPIEYIHQCKQSLIQQREIKKHANSFSDALRSSLREDPDYIMVGEIRDLETIRLALNAAETGHLVLASLHTNSAAESIDRMVDVFPTFEKSLIRSIVANSLQAVISQRLLKKIGGGRVAATEVMICTSAIRSLIRENKAHQIYSAIQTGKSNGMYTLSHSVRELINNQLIDNHEHIHLLDQ